MVGWSLSENWENSQMKNPESALSNQPTLPVHAGGSQGTRQLSSLREGLGPAAPRPPEAPAEQGGGVGTDTSL